MAEVSLNEVQNQSQKRFDPEYFNSVALLAAKKLEGAKTLGDFVKDGYRVVYENTEAIEFDGESSLPYFLQSSDISTPFISRENMIRVSESDWLRYSKGRIKAGELLIEVKGKAEKIAIVPADFPEKTLVTGTCYKMTTKRDDDKYLVATFLLSKYGLALKDRLKTNLLVSYIAKDDLYSLPIPTVSDDFLSEIKRLYTASENMRHQAHALLQQAEALLLSALGLEQWQPPEALTYERSASEVFGAGRLDAEYFAPKITQLLERLSQDGQTLADVAPARHERFIPERGVNFQYIEIGGIKGDGTAEAEAVAGEDAPSRATWYVHENDVVTSTVRPIRRLTAIISPEQGGNVCSSGFVVLEPQNISPEVLMTYLRLPYVCQILDLRTSASLYPALSERDLMTLPIPIFSTEIEAKVVENVRQSHAMRESSQRLLETAKRAVEMAIEESEAAALEHLHSAENLNGQ